MKLGGAIKEYRTRRKLSLKALADQTGLSVGYLSLLEREKRDPTLSTVERIAHALGISVFMLVLSAQDDTELTAFDADLKVKLAYAVLQSFE